MLLKCKLGFHSWNGCKCTKCGKARDEQHKWSNWICTVCEKKNIENIIEYGLLHKAAMDGDVTRVKNLLESNLNPNIVVKFDSNDWGGTPLHLVTRLLGTCSSKEKEKNLLEIAKLLIKHGTFLFYPFNNKWDETSGGFLYRSYSILDYARNYNKLQQIVKLLPKLKLSFNYIEVNIEFFLSNEINWTRDISIYYGKTIYPRKLYKKFKVSNNMASKKGSLPEPLPIKFEDDGFPSMITLVYEVNSKEIVQYIDVEGLNNYKEYIYISRNEYFESDKFKIFIKPIKK